MKNTIAAIVLLSLITAGCDSLRLAPTEVQKQNAWLHNRTAAVAAQTARAEQTDEDLQKLTTLSELQSRAFVSYFGIPQKFPQADTTDQILDESSFKIADAAIDVSAQRVDSWQLADNIFELAIALSALVGGVYGTRVVRFLKQARTKSKALQEIITGSELFKSKNPESAAAFKQAQQNQSAQTRQLVAQLKTENT